MDLQQLDNAREEAVANWRHAQLLIGEVEHLVEQRLPAIAQSIHGVKVLEIPGLLRSEFEGSELAGYLASAESLLRETVHDVRERVEESARAGVRVAAEEIQASLMRAQLAIDEALDDETELPAGDGSERTPRILAGIDHRITLAVHTVQRLRILADSWPGVQRANCTVAEIMESARGRIPRLDAVDYEFDAATAHVIVEGLVVEPVIVALAELLDNAASHSGRRVSAFAQRMPSGMRITVDDSGAGMSPLQLEDAERALTTGSADVTNLSEPFRLGFLVIGRLADVYGLRVGLSPSPSGGVRAGLLIPAERLNEAGFTRSPAAVTSPPALKPAALDGETPLAQALSIPLAPTTVAPWATVPILKGSEAPGTDAEAVQSSQLVPWGHTPNQVPEDEVRADAHGLPKRRPRRPLPRVAEQAQEGIADPDDYTRGFEQIGRIMADGFDEDHL
ncbi:hypothetical protein [Streptomyces sp. NPDC056549]|uniref:ATP-binding protein n=1 Tax=Streptomyces sp. NPDC056549 TaxID=3345864 RepID=UPI00368C6DC1